MVSEKEEFNVYSKIVFFSEESEYMCMYRETVKQ